MPTDPPTDPDHHFRDGLITAGVLEIRSERQADGEHRITLSGDFDLSGADAFDAEMVRVEATDARSVVVDLSGLDFIDSTGLRMLLVAEARSRSDSNRLALVRGPQKIHRVFTLAGVAEMLPFR